MSELMAMFCDIDDVCKWFDPLYPQRRLQDGQRHRVRQGQLALSELVTIIVSFPRSHYRDFKPDDTEYVAVPLRPDFPALVISSRLVDLMSRALVPLCTSLHTRRGRCTGLTFVDSTWLAVCHHQRIVCHTVFADWATRGQCAMGGMWASNGIGGSMIRASFWRFGGARVKTRAKARWLAFAVGGHFVRVDSPAKCSKV